MADVGGWSVIHNKAPVKGDRIDMASGCHMYDDCDFAKVTIEGKVFYAEGNTERQAKLKVMDMVRKHYGL